MVADRQFLTLAAFFSLALNGLTFTFLGTSLPTIQSFLDISIEHATLLVVSLQAGFTLCSLAGGILSDYVQRERILMFGCLLLAISCLVFCSASSLFLNILIAFTMGSGIGCILSGSNTLLVTLYPQQKGTILNIHHIFFGLGLFFGPLIMGYLIAHEVGWRLGFITEAIALIALALVFFFAKGTKPERNTTINPLQQVLQLSMDRKFQVILLVNFLAVGTQVTITVLGVSYLIEAKECTLTSAGITISVFSIALMTGRYLCSQLTLVYKHTTIILTLLWLQLFTLLLLWWSSTWLAMAAVALSGFAFSGIFPTSLALSSILFPRVTGSALGILSTFGALGSLVISWMIGVVTGLTDMQSGFIVVIISCITAVALFQMNRRSLLQQEVIYSSHDIGQVS